VKTLSDLGDLLKKAREQKGYSLDDIQEMTKIRKRYLEAIEDGNYKVLPGSFYLRAFVKNYSETVGLDAEEVLRLYQKDIPTPVRETVAEQPMLKPRRASSQTSDRIGKWGFRLLMWSFIAVIAVVVYMFAINKDSNRDNQTLDDGTRITDRNQPSAGDESNSSTGDNGGSPETAPTEPKPVPAKPQTALTFVEKVNSRTDRYQVTPAGTHTYEVTVAEGGSWVAIRKEGATGEKLHYKTESNPTVISYEYDGTIYIDVARSDHVEIKVDGVLLDDGNGMRKKFIIDPAADAAATGQAAGQTEGQTTNP
jgi:cytoskeletal protein RodZ